MIQSFQTGILNIKTFKQSRGEHEMKIKKTFFTTVLCSLALWSASAHAEKATFQIAPLQFEAPAAADTQNYQQITLAQESDGPSDEQRPTEQILRLSKKVYLSNRDITSSSIGIDDFGSFSVDLTFNRQGARKLAELTRNNIDRQLAVIDSRRNELLIVPVIRSEITGGKLAVSGGMSSPQQARQIADESEIEFRLVAEAGNQSDDYQSMTFNTPVKHSNAPFFVWLYRPLNIESEDIDKWVIQPQLLSLGDENLVDFPESFYYRVGVKLNKQGLAKWRRSKEQPFYLITTQAGKTKAKQVSPLGSDAILLHLAFSLDEANQFVQQFK